MPGTLICMPPWIIRLTVLCTMATLLYTSTTSIPARILDPARAMLRRLFQVMLSRIFISQVRKTTRSPDESKSERSRYVVRRHFLRCSRLDVSRLATTVDSVNRSVTRPSLVLSVRNRVWTANIAKFLRPSTGLPAQCLLRTLANRFTGRTVS